jgi:hypothetical protein
MQLQPDGQLNTWEKPLHLPSCSTQKSSLKRFSNSLNENVIKSHFLLPAMGTNEDITSALEAEMGGDLEDGDGQE